MAFLKKSKTTADEPELRETTDPEDARLLADEIVALIQTSAYDDMTWAEIDAGLRLASHDVKVLWGLHGAVKPPVETLSLKRERERDRA